MVEMMLSNILQCTGQPLTTKNYLALNLSSAIVENAAQDGRWVFEGYRGS